MKGIRTYVRYYPYHKGVHSLALNRKAALHLTSARCYYLDLGWSLLSSGCSLKTHSLWSKRERSGSGRKTHPWHM